MIDSDDDPDEWRRQSIVKHGNNLPCGLTPMEHVHLAVAASQLPQVLAIPEELLLNMQWLFNLPMDEGHVAAASQKEETPLSDKVHCDMVDAYRRRVVSGWYEQAAKLHQNTIAWIANAPRSLYPAVKEWNGPLIDHLCKAAGHADSFLVRDLQQGFPMVGEIEVYDVSARPKSKVDLTCNTVEELWTRRKTSNRKLFFSVTEDLNSQDIWDAVAAEVKYGAMTAPTPEASPEDLNDCVVSRRFMVEQITEKHGQQVQAFRQIDHLTESA